ncbi:TIR domain-containing protein [Sphingomonas hankyongi]
MSYARADRATARMFADGLAAEGFSVWWDASLHSGETFDEVIEQKLRDAGAVVVLWSPRSVSSRWVRAEATLADRRKKLAPAIIEQCDRPIIFELTHAADLCEWTGDVTDIHWRTFVDDLRRLLETRRNEEAAAQGHAAPHPAPKPAHHPAPQAQPATRQPLRPGSHEVIFAGRSRAPAATDERQEHAGELPVQQAPAADPQGEVHCLELEDSALGDDVFIIDSSGVKIGRKDPADIVLSDKSISREHCIIGLASDELLVTDLNSTNGTYIDDSRITRATILPVGSLLRIGQVALRHNVRTRAEAEAHGSFVSPNRGLPPGRLAAAS